MKIGILTFHRANNFGAVLQCFALQNYLKKLGAEVYVIDYRQKYIESIYNTISLVAIFRNLFHPKGLLKYLRGTSKRMERNKIFRGFASEYLYLSQKVTSNKIIGYDVIVHGSDQIWNPKLTGGKYDDIYMGNYLASCKCRKIGYALSFEEIPIEENAKNYVHDSINNFSAIAVRERNLVGILSSVTDKNIDVVVDPTLLLEGKDYEKLISAPSIKEPYVLVYAVGPKEIAIEVAQTIAKERGLRVIDISQKNISPNEFLGYIKYANFVVAVSFHGTVFSILFHKDFYTILAGQKSDVRYKELLKNTNLQDRLIGSVPEYITNVDFRDFDKRRETYSSNSKDYINMLITEEL